MRYPYHSKLFKEKFLEIKYTIFYCVGEIIPFYFGSGSISDSAKAKNAGSTTVI
jgi:hypothetical protein